MLWNVGNSLGYEPPYQEGVGHDSNTFDAVADCNHNCSARRVRWLRMCLEGLI